MGTAEKRGGLNCPQENPVFEVGICALGGEAYPAAFPKEIPGFFAGDLGIPGY